MIVTPTEIIEGMILGMNPYESYHRYDCSNACGSMIFTLGLRKVIILNISMKFIPIIQSDIIINFKSKQLPQFKLDF